MNYRGYRKHFQELSDITLTRYLRVISSNFKMTFFCLGWGGFDFRYPTLQRLIGHTHFHSVPVVPVVFQLTSLCNGFMCNVTKTDHRILLL